MNYIILIMAKSLIKSIQNYCRKWSLVASKFEILRNLNLKSMHRKSTIKRRNLTWIPTTLHGGTETKLSRRNWKVTTATVWDPVLSCGPLGFKVIKNLMNQLAQWHCGSSLKHMFLSICTNGYLPSYKVGITFQNVSGK